MSSLYVPLVLRLEVSDHSKIIRSFKDDSKTVAPSPTAGERTRQRLISTGMKKRNSPTANQQAGGKRAGAPAVGDLTQEPSHAYHKGRRTYSEVVVESLDGTKLFDSPSSSSIAGTSEQTVVSPPRSVKSTSAEPAAALDHAAYYSGNPLTEKTEGIMHFYKYNDEKLTIAAQCRMVCMFGISAKVSVSEIISFIGVSLPMIEKLKVVRDATPNIYMIIIKFKEHNDAVTFYEEYNNCPFNDLEPYRCQLLFVDRLECTTSEELVSANSTCLTELPTCAVCLERMDESVLAILCNHSFHAQCLEQWADNTCPVCRYVQNPEVVAEQRCNDCGQSNDLWMCLICGNIGCGRYASQHAQRHWESTSHTFSLKIGGEQVWDYAGDNYVHRLIENSDGKLVEVQREQTGNGDEKNGKGDKLEGIKLEYTLLLTSQLENQRKYFEDRLADVELAMSKMEKIACAQVESLEQQVKEQTAELKVLKGELTDTQKVKQTVEKKANSTTDKVSKLTGELKDERAINEMLRKDQGVWKNQFEKLLENHQTSRQQYEKKIEDLQSQVNDLLMHFETQTKLNEQLASGTVTKEEISESRVGVEESPSAPKRNQRKKKK